MFHSRFFRVWFAVLANFLVFFHLITLRISNCFFLRFLFFFLHGFTSPSSRSARLFRPMNHFCVVHPSCATGQSLLGHMSTSEPFSSGTAFVPQYGQTLNSSSFFFHSHWNHLFVFMKTPLPQHPTPAIHTIYDVISVIPFRDQNNCMMHV